MSLPYTFDGFQSVDDFLVYEMNYTIDCILGIPWLARYQPHIDWLARSVKRRADFDVSEVFTRLLVTPSDWPHVRVVDQSTTSHTIHRNGDGPLCMVCAVSMDEAVEQGLPQTNEAVEQRLPRIFDVVEQRLPHPSEAVERARLPHDIGAGDDDSPRLEEGETLGSDSSSSTLSRGSRRTKSSRCSQRRLKPRHTLDVNTTSDMVCVVEYSVGSARKRRTIEVASPPRDALRLSSDCRDWRGNPSSTS